MFFLKSKIKFSPQKITENGIVTVSTKVNSHLNKFSFMSMKKIPENLKMSSMKVSQKYFSDLQTLFNFTQLYLKFISMF